jgi:hypothetical protein
VIVADGEPTTPDKVQPVVFGIGGEVPAPFPPSDSNAAAGPAAASQQGQPSAVASSPSGRSSGGDCRH